MSHKMNSQKNRKDLIDRSTAGIALIWLGMVAGISFLEAPVKFMAPSVTLAIGLDIGRHVFGIFNKVECAIALTIAIFLIIIRKKDRSMIFIGFAWLVLALQTVWQLSSFGLQLGGFRGRKGKGLLRLELPVELP